MKQASHPKMPKFGKTLKNNEGASEEELIIELKTRTKAAIMKSDAKKAFLKELIDNKAEILTYCQSFDSLTNSTLAPSMKILTPVNYCTIEKTSNADLSVLVAKVLPPLRILRSYIIEQYDIENKRKHQKVFWTGYRLFDLIWIC